MALGYHALSMPVTGIGPVKATLMGLDAAALREAILPDLKVTTRERTLRGRVREFCLDSGVPV